MPQSYGPYKVREKTNKIASILHPLAKDVTVFSVIYVCMFQHTTTGDAKTANSHGLLRRSYHP